jgi:hypothetical protein
MEINKMLSRRLTPITANTKQQSFICVHRRLKMVFPV